MRAALYIRLSEETDTTTSPERQREATRKYAEARGWTVVGVFEDIDVSATHNRLERPGLTRLRADAVASAVDVVVVYRLDRLARNALDSLMLLEEWRRLGVAIASTSEGLDLSTPAGKAMFTLISVFAEMEAEAIKARVTASIDRLRNSGRFAGGTVPYGYTTAPRPDGAGRILVVVPEEADTVREVAERLLSGEAPYRICQNLNTRGVPSPRSERRKVARMDDQARLAADLDVASADPGIWRVQSLTRLMTGDHLVGRQVHGGRPITDERGLPAQVWPPILTVAELERLRQRRPADQPKQIRRVRAARLLSGLAYCAECGKKMYVRTSGGRPIYGCASSSRGELCPSPRVSAEALETHIDAVARARFGQVQMTEVVAAEEVAPIGVEFQQVERALREVAEELTRPGADFNALTARLALLHKTREELTERGAAVTVFTTSRPTGQTWEQTWDALDADGRRRMLGDWIWAIRVAPTTSRSRHLDVERIEIIWDTPENVELADPAGVS